MNPVWGHVAGAVTVTLTLVFLGIWYWAWRPHHQRTFEQLAQLPMDDRADAVADDEAMRP